ncbi:MAG: sortase B protein-sorting domain-containing protein, partial [Lachnospiraceae bacterium]|nr:sortase B protein-sorting domain-containing protein [Lachnospiraceae bacterium]
QDFDISESTSAMTPNTDESSNQQTATQDAGPDTTQSAGQETVESTEQAAGTEQTESTNQSGGTNKPQGTTQGTEEQKSPGFQTYDEASVWTTNTQVEIFRISHENDDHEVTVSSDNGDKIIAPGTRNSYTFKLKNTGNVPMDYTVSIDAYFTPGDVAMPITGRLSRHDGKWIVGDQEEYAEVATLNGAQDSATLSQGRYCYYVLEWEWPYESGNDNWDTWLGDLAVSQDLTFTIVINTTATESTNPSADIGMIPKTGDDSMVALWVILAAGSLLIIIILMFLKTREGKTQGSEKERKEDRLQE